MVHLKLMDHMLIILTFLKKKKMTFRRDKSIETQSILKIQSQGLGRKKGDGEWLLNRFFFPHGASFWNDKFLGAKEVMVAQHCENAKCYQIVHFKG